MLRALQDTHLLFFVYSSPLHSLCLRSDIVTIRGFLLRLLSRLVIASDSKCSDDSTCDNEFNSILDFVATVYEVCL